LGFGHSHEPQKQWKGSGQRRGAIDCGKQIAHSKSPKLKVKISKEICELPADMELAEPSCRYSLNCETMKLVNNLFI